MKDDLQQAITDSKPRRVVLALQPRLIREAIRHRLEEMPDVEVVGEAESLIDLLIVIDRTGADAVIHSWAEAGRTPPMYSRLFEEYPHLTVIGVEPGEGQIYSCRQILLCSPLPSATVDSMVAAIRPARQLT